MAIDKILGNGDLDRVADSVFSAVSDSVSEIKAMQKRKAAENVQVVIQALKKIESDLQDKYDGVTTVLEKRVASIKDGQDGRNGADGRNGKDGRPGRDGLPGPKGNDGLSGRDGVDGVDGVSVTEAHIDFDGSLIISLSNGREINVGEVVAPDLAERIKVITNGGGTSQGVLDTLVSPQNQINALVSLGAVTYEGTWNASTNTPTIVAGTGDKGEYYVVSVAGNTSIDGETLWGVGDWIIFNGVVWQKVDGGSTGDLTSLTVRDNTTLGSSNTDNVTFNARIASEFTPATDNAFDLGRTGHEWRDLFIDGTANIDSLVADTADINGGTVDGTTIGATTPSTGNFTVLTENASPVVVQTDIGTAPNEIPLNQYLGEMAYMNAEAVVIQPQATAVPNGIGDMVFQLTSDTSLEVKVKGSDGVVRSVTLTLA